MGESLTLSLPDTQKAIASKGNATSVSVTVDDASGIANLAGADIGLYMFCNGGQTNIGTESGSTEGMWTLSADGTASVELYGRKAWGGTNVAVVTNGGIEAGTTLTSLTLTTTGLSGGTDDYAVFFGVVDSSGSLLASSTQNNLGTAGANITLNSFGTDNADTIVWNEGYTLLMGFVSEAGGSWDTKTYVNGIKLQGEAAPEPTTATLSLLALAGLAARRRR